jgi:phosphohistidine phosphatase SixA
LVLGLLGALSATGLRADEAGWAALSWPGAIVLIRHAYAPGFGDPPGMRLDDCATQRNLNDQGRAQARRLGERLRQRGIRVDAVLNSPWCRTRDTAQLLMMGPTPRDEPAFGSFFAGQGDPARQTAAAREILRQWRGPGALVVVTHQVNVQGLTGVSPSTAESLVVRVPAGNGPLQVLGRIDPPD